MPYYGRDIPFSHSLGLTASQDSRVPCHSDYRVCLMRKNDEGAVKSGLRSILVPNPVFGLFVVALTLLLIAVYVFGTRGQYSDPDIADLLRTIAIGALAAGITGIIDRSFLVKTINSEI